MSRSATQDPLEKFRFAVNWGADTTDELDVNGAEQPLTSPVAKAGFHDVQIPKRSTTKVAYREGVDPDVSSQSAGLTSMEDIVLSKGLVPDAADFAEFSAWVAQVHSGGDTTAKLDATVDRARPKTGALVYRKDVTIWMYNRSGEIKRVWKLYNAFPVNYVPGSDMSADDDGEKSLESLTLGYEDFIEILPGAGGTIPTSDVPALPSE